MINPSSMNRALEGERIHRAIRDFIVTGEIDQRFEKYIKSAEIFMDGLTDLRPEVSFSMPTSIGPMNGRVDLVARDAKGRTVVVDWKTVRNDRDLPNVDFDGALAFGDMQLLSYVEWAYREGAAEVEGNIVTISSSGRHAVQFANYPRETCYQAFGNWEISLAREQLLDEQEVLKLAEVYQNCLDVDNLRAYEGKTWKPRVVEPARLRELVANRSAWL